MKVTVGAKTDTGRVREGNQDTILVEAPLFGVADGMGGHLAGDVASATAVEVVTKMAKEEPGDPSKLPAFIRTANKAIWTKAREDSRLQGMGTTFTLALLKDSTAHLAHVGDSRAYLFRGGQLRQITEDHTLVERMVQEGRLSRDEAPHHPQRSVITRALGADQVVEVDTLEQPIEEGDKVLLCSDGLSSMLDDSAIAAALDSDARPQELAERLIDLANEAGGEDNISVVILALGDQEATPGSHPAPVSERAPTVASAEPSAERDAVERSVTPIPETRDGSDVEDEEGAPARKSGGRKALIALVIIALIIGGGYLAARAALDNSWFVGASENGEVVVYQGIPDEIAGFSFSEERERTGLSLEDLCPFQRSDVTGGIKAGSFEEAEQTVANLRDRSEGLNCARSSKN